MKQPQYMLPLLQLLTTSVSRKQRCAFFIRMPHDAIMIRARTERNCAPRGMPATTNTVKKKAFLAINGCWKSKLDSPEPSQER